MDSDRLIEHLGLEPHVEGGYFRRSYASTVAADGAGRPALTTIYYLLTDRQPVGHWHRNRSDIVHFFHVGAPLTYWLIDPDGGLRRVRLGPALDDGEQLQLAVPGGVWKTSVLEHGAFALISEAVSPGFDYRDMTLGRAAELCRQFPQHRELLERYSRH